MELIETDSLATAVRDAITSGNVPALRSLLSGNEGLAGLVIVSPNGSAAGARSLLHIATDWPGHFPNVVETISLLVASGADVNARFRGRHRETPLHWAASSDDVAALETLLDLGGDIEADGGVIGNGTPLADAVAFAQWRAARKLVERGAAATLWQAAALGLMDRVQSLFINGHQPAQDEITNAFWCACHGGQLAAAQYLHARGADVHWVGHDRLTPVGAARRSNAGAVVQWLNSLAGKDSRPPA